MSDFYDEMYAMATELLAPTIEGGLGQGRIVLSRSTPGEEDPERPWLPVEPTTVTEVLKGAASGVDTRLVGSEVGGSVILSSDKQIVCSAPDMDYKAGDVLSLDGKPVHIVSVQKIPAVGTTVAVKFIVRG